MHDIASSALMGMMELGGVVAYVLYDLPPHLRARWAPLPMDPSAMPPYSFVIYRRGVEPGHASGQQGFHNATYCMRVASPCSIHLSLDRLNIQCTQPGYESHGYAKMLMARVFLDAVRRTNGADRFYAAGYQDNPWAAFEFHPHPHPTSASEAPSWNGIRMVLEADSALQWLVSHQYLRQEGATYALTAHLPSYSGPYFCGFFTNEEMLGGVSSRELVILKYCSGTDGLTRFIADAVKIRMVAWVHDSKTRRVARTQQQTEEHQRAFEEEISFDIKHSGSVGYIAYHWVPGNRPRSWEDRQPVCFLIYSASKEMRDQPTGFKTPRTAALEHLRWRAELNIRVQRINRCK
jgi:hypothetical protein